MVDRPSKAPPATPASVEAHYVKSAQFRVIHADGVFGGLTPTGQIHAAFFSQRSAIPKMIEFKVTPEGQLGDELRREGRSGFIRELEIDAIFSVEVAKAFRAWLDEKIAEHDSIAAKMSESK